MYKTLCMSIMIVLTMTACGFQLKGSTQATQMQQHLRFPQLQLDIPTAYSELQTQLNVHLVGSGIQLNTPNAPILKVTDYQFRRQQLNGKLTEVLLHLNATFYITDAQGRALTQPRTVKTYRNYQYNIETVNTENQQEQYLKRIMVDDIAQQINTQIINNRLPVAK